jgi:hypothetical protein
MNSTIDSSHVIPGALYGAPKSVPKYPSGFSLRALITPNQLAVLISENKSKKIFQLQPFQFTENISKSEWIKEIDSLLRTEWFFKQEWSVKKITIFLPAFTLVPAQFYSLDLSETLISWNITKDQNDEVLYDGIEGTDIRLIYTIPKQLLFQLPPEAEIQHTLTVLLRYLLQSRDSLKSLNIYVYIQQSSFQLIYIKDRSLKFCNSFNYKSPYDFIYYLLFACKQLDLDPKNLSVTLMGEIMRESYLFQLLHTYVRNVEFAPMPSGWQFDTEYPLPGHFFYNLFCI